MGNLMDLTGKRFGKLTVIGQDTTYSGRGVKWLCKCDCGNEKRVLADNLRNGGTVSCGCYRRQRITKANTTHGHKNSRLYNIWRGMKLRCGNVKRKDYERYGGRGITVCSEWVSDFEAFYDWAMAHGYDDNLSIDRIDNDKGYSPNNCQWATDKTQDNNRRSSRKYSIDGVELSVTQWCEKYKKNWSTVFSRLRYGWTIEEALDLIPRSK